MTAIKNTAKENKKKAKPDGIAFTFSLRIYLTIFRRLVGLSATLASFSPILRLPFYFFPPFQFVCPACENEKKIGKTVDEWKNMFS
jgi:hypothetical protein